MADLLENYEHEGYYKRSRQRTDPVSYTHLDVYKRQPYKHVKLIKTNIQF